ncbi:CMRF35-like molecule 2 [Micropterus salmoides]|uniref:CMRF35-like molecule 2 n=1 Tax=Micropterus salmoides TaxID=27706 RepID=UPI0018ED00CD|nr:CMRF35-like molecule 2 [Micropterus salmoides]
MQSLQNMLVILFIPLSCVMSAAKEIQVFGYEQSEVKVSCPYEDGYESYKKYLCRNECDYDHDVVITTTEMKKDRYFVHDDQKKHIFTVTISNLHYTDAGKYWCMVEKFWWDLLTAEVKVEVMPEWCCVKTKKLSGIVGHPVIMQCPYPPQHWDNRKFLCKGDHRNNCTDMGTSHSRFTLQNDVSSSSFLVTITELKAGDAAIYWCGSDSQWSPGNYTKIQLSVVFPKQTSTVRSTSIVISTSTVVDPVGSQTTHIPGKDIKVSD